MLWTMSLTWARAIGLLGLLLAIRFFTRLHYQRSLVKGLPGPPHSYLFGSILSMGAVMVTQPKDLAPQALMKAVQEYYNLPDCFYVDLWPMAYPLVVMPNISMFEQICLEKKLPKHPVTDAFMRLFGGPGNLVSSEGQEWKKWRSVFNPGFAPNNLMAMVPFILEECQTFCDIMTEHAKKNDIFRMELAATKLTVSIIGKVVLDLDLDAQKSKNPLVEAFASQTRWAPLGVHFQPSELWDIRRPLMLRYNTWKMDRYISDCLEERFATRETRGKTRHVIDLAFESYLKEVKGTSGDLNAVNKLDRDFKQAAISNMKTFIFAGHDTTSSTICYSFYYLSKNPDVLAKIRKEHDEVFGPDPDQVVSRLIEDPHLLAKLEYTLAVTKEVLRIQPPASTVRVAPEGSVLHDPETGESLPVANNMILFPVNVGMHRNPKYWKDPNTFNPDRFLPGSTDNTSAWIPFSKGNRNCIGQELAIIETKVILAMILRRFDFVAAYDELDKLKGDGSGYPNLTEGVLEFCGERAYQIQKGTAKPAEGMPCRLKLR